jgi:hypothetical protein
MLQGSSSAAPIYNFNSDVTLNAYQKIAKGTTFTHPSTRKTITIHATQYLDDKAATINEAGLGSTMEDIPTQENCNQLFAQANQNTETWTKLLWVSSGNLS